MALYCRPCMMFEMPGKLAGEAASQIWKSKISVEVGFILRKKGAMNVQTNYCQRC